jgi:hypothetical protein
VKLPVTHLAVRLEKWRKLERERGEKGEDDDDLMWRK